MRARPARVLVLLTSCALCGCPAPSPGVAAPDAGAGCFDSRDCPGPLLGLCNLTTSQCEPSCGAREDCTAAVRGALALPDCDRDGGLGCECERDPDDSARPGPFGRCAVALCGSDASCRQGEVCRDGQCVAPPRASAVARCEVIPEVAVLRVGASARFSVLGWDTRGAPLVLSGGARWTALHGAVSSEGPRFTGVAESSLVEAVEAELGAVRCRARARVLPATVAPGRLEVVAWDLATGRPVRGAAVLVSAGTAAVRGPALTDANGRAAFARLSPAVVSVTVFHPDFDYQTIAPYDLDAPGPDARLLAFPLQRNARDRVGRVSGVLLDRPDTSFFLASWLGVAEPALHERLEQDPDLPAVVKVGAFEGLTELPTRLTVELTASGWGKSRWHAVGPSGTCADEAAVETGACGTASVGGFAGTVPVCDAFSLLVATGFCAPPSADGAVTLRRLRPLIRRFQSVVQRDVSYRRSSSVTSSFTFVDLPFGQLPLAFPVTVRVPGLPSIAGLPADAVLVRALARVPGRGLVPLGMGVGLNTAPRDARVDPEDLLSEAGLLGARLAPAHHGLEGAEQLVVATALDSRQLRSPLSTSAVVARLPGNAPRFDPTGQFPIELPPFLPVPRGGRYNFTAAAVGDLGPRAFRFGRDPGLGSATEVRVVFTDSAGHRWVVRLDPAEAAAGFTLPAVPAPLADRTLAAALEVQALRLEEGGELGFRQLAELNGTNADRLAELTTASSALVHRPFVSWKSGTVSGPLQRGAAVVVQVDGFKVGTTPLDDGLVRLAFDGGAGCPSVDVDRDPSAVGEVAIGLPAGCRGAAVRMTATLHRSDGAPLEPPVSASVTVAIE